MSYQFVRREILPSRTSMTSTASNSTRFRRRPARKAHLCRHHVARDQDPRRLVAVFAPEGEDVGEVRDDLLAPDAGTRTDRHELGVVVPELAHAVPVLGVRTLEVALHERPVAVRGDRATVGTGGHWCQIRNDRLFDMIRLVEFELDEEMPMFRGSVAQVGRQGAPEGLRRELERNEHEYPFELWDKFTAAGFHGIGIPEEYGGQGGDVVTQMILAPRAGPHARRPRLGVGHHLLRRRASRSGSTAPRSRSSASCPRSPRASCASRSASPSPAAAPTCSAAMRTTRRAGRRRLGDQRPEDLVLVGATSPTTSCCWPARTTTSRSATRA